MIELWVVLLIITWHYIFDFMFQTSEQALNKSQDFEILTEHVLIYSISWIFPITFILNSFPTIALFIFITFLTHLLTDYITSKITSKKFINEQYYTKVPNVGAFSVIGFDQLLHYFQLFITIFLLI